MCRIVGAGGACVMLWVMVAVSGAGAQETLPEKVAVGPGEEPAVVDGRELISRAYGKTGEAKTIDDLAEIVDLCDRGVAAGLSSDKIDYVEKLKSWALNKRGEAYSDKALELADQGNPSQAGQLDELAMADFDAAVQMDPSRWQAWKNRGVNHAMLGNYDDALADFDRAIELYTKYANTWFNRAEVHFELGQFAEAEADYTEVILRKPRDAAARTGRGHALCELVEEALCGAASENTESSVK